MKIIARHWKLLLFVFLFSTWACAGFQSAWEQTSASAAQHQPAVVTPQKKAIPSLPTNLPASVRAFLEMALPYAVQAHQTLGWQTSVILAQWGLEHGWTVPDSQGFNWGNTTYAPDCPKSGRFCYASTPEEGLREYIYTAQLPWYKPVRNAVPLGADATAVALGESPWDAGHYTVDGHPGDSLLAILHEFGFAQVFDK